jgi:hypothetical protein
MASVAQLLVTQARSASVVHAWPQLQQRWTVGLLRGAASYIPSAPVTAVIAQALIVGMRRANARSRTLAQWRLTLPLHLPISANAPHSLVQLFRGLDAKVLSALSSGFIYFYAYAFLKVGAAACTRCCSLVC